MARTIKSKVKVSEIIFDEELYPRESYNWQTGYDYSQSMLAGAKFPPITLALYRGKKYLVDGKHRLEAIKLLKKDTINAVTHTGWSKEKIYKEAVKLNITHGRGLSPYEKRKIALKLMEMKCKNSEISKLIQVPENKLTSFVGERLVNSITGEEIDEESGSKIAKEIGRAILKSGVKHFAGNTLGSGDFQEIQSTQKDFYMSSQMSLLNQLVELLEKDLLNRKDKRIMDLIRRIKKLLKNY